MSSFWEDDDEASIQFSAPLNFRHTSSIAYDPEHGFEIRNIPQEWRKLFQAAGIKKAELSDSVDTSASPPSTPTDLSSPQSTTSSPTPQPAPLKPPSSLSAPKPITLQPATSSPSPQPALSKSPTSLSTPKPQPATPSPSLPSPLNPPTSSLSAPKPPQPATSSKSPQPTSFKLPPTSQPATSSLSAPKPPQPATSSKSPQPTPFKLPPTPQPATSSLSNKQPPTVKLSPRPLPPPGSAPVGGEHSLHFDGEWKIKIPQAKFTSKGRYSTLPLDPTIYNKEHATLTSYLSPLASFSPTAIELVNNSHILRLFHGTIEECELRQQSPAFHPSLDGESETEQRNRVLQHLDSHPSTAKHNRKVKIIRAWHGTNIKKANSILTLGFANLATLDDGWFGKGIYFSSSPEYAAQYCANQPDPCLLMCYILIFNPYPVIWEDAKSSGDLRFEGKANYRNFFCHYVPVVEYRKMEYLPDKNGVIGPMDEIVIFNEHHVLPYAIVTLTKNLTEEISTSTTAVSPDILFCAVAHTEFSGEGQEGQVLKLNVGEVVAVIKKDEEGWWFGFLPTNPDFQGYFPGSYVTPMNLPMNLASLQIK